MVTYRVSRIIDAPMKYVYDWATDYTEDDNYIWGSKFPRIILFKSKKKTVYASYKNGSDRKPKLAVRIITLHPSNYYWHLDYYAEEDLETADYRLTRLRKNKTRLDMIFKNIWKHGSGPSSKDFEKDVNFVWDKYTPALEKDYKSGKKANS
jgi:hypothetical protein